MPAESYSLRIGDHLVLRAEGGPPEAEFVLFDERDLEIDMAAPHGPPHSAYRTTAAQALERLREAGITLTLAKEAAGVVRPELAMRYARGPLVRRVAEYLGPAELFEGRTFDGRRRRYLGGWLDLNALGKDSRVTRATTAMQALHLVALLSECEPGATVVLSIPGLTQPSASGKRQRPSCPLEQGTDLPMALDRLRRHPLPRGSSRETGPTLEELLANVRGRMIQSGSPTMQARLMKIERALVMRECPSSGPLSDPELWSLEVRLALGEPWNVLDVVEGLERAHGHMLATTYLRLHASLMAGTVDNSVLASQAAVLAESSGAFSELRLLAARATAIAGDRTRALDFADAVASDTRAHPDLRNEASELKNDIVAGRSVRPSTLPPIYHDSSPPPSVLPLHSAGVVTEETDRTRAPDSMRSVAHRAQVYPHVAVERPATPGGDRFSEAAAGNPHPRAVAAVNVVPARHNPSAWSSLARGTVRVPRLPRETRVLLRPAGRSGTPLGQAMARWVAPSPGDAASVLDAEIESDRQGGHQEPRPAREEGFSRPSFSSEPATAAPPEPLLPRLLDTGETELVRALSPPPGMRVQPEKLDVIPASAIEGRAIFSALARGLAREIEAKFGGELKTNVRAVDALQRSLRARFPDGDVSSDKDHFDLRRHGALLSELLARVLGGYWIETPAGDALEWAMFVPPETRVWPFARVLRFVKMGRAESDLVSYYLELEARVLRALAGKSSSPS